MSKLILALAILLGIYAALRIGVAFVSRMPAIGGIQSTSNGEQLGDCPNKPNCNGSQASRQSQTVAPLVVLLNISDAIPTIVTAMDKLGGKVTQQSDNYLHVTFKTLLMGFTDDVEFLVDTVANVVHVRSASRLGHSDLGVNKKRIDRIRKQLDGRL